MPRHTTTRLAVAALALAMLGAPCSTTGPGPRDFAAGALVIPMDNCYQRRDAANPTGTACTAPAGADDGVLRAYGLVYFLLKNGVTVYWAIDGATPKGTRTTPDVTVSAPASGAVVQKLNWTTGAFADFGYPAATGITYVGGPFIVDAADAARAVAMMTSAADAAHADFARLQAEATIDVHSVTAPFRAAEVRPLTTVPPRIAILNVTPPAGKKTSSNVMYQYAVAAGLSWPCRGDGDCAGGLGPGCNKAAVLAYLANPAGDAAIPQVCNGPLCAPNFNTGPGLIYDLLCDGDFIPPAAGTGYADTQLAKGDYRLLWIPHWDTSGTTPTGATDASVVPPLPATTAADKLAWQLRTIAAYVQAGNNVFAECLAIQALEGVAGQDSVNGRPLGIPATRFQTPSGIQKWNGTGAAPAFLDPAHPNMQVGDYAFSVVSGAITTYYPVAASPAVQPAVAYRTGVERLIVETATASATVPPFWDVSGTFRVPSTDGQPRGSVAYLGGHNYSPTSDAWPHASAGQTAGTRIVLNTLFNLGFSCSDPNTTCQVPGQDSTSACAQGVLKCSVAGGFVCEPIVRPGQLTEVCGNGIDDNCDGTVDEGCAGACTPNATRQCDGGAPAGQICVRGTQTCSALGIWGACDGLRLKSPEACNGVDDDCDGQVDEGTICPFGQTCTGGVCLPQPCDLEVRCPAGYTCTGASPASVCTPDPCAGGAPCPVGRVCSAGACVDPCAAIRCGPGSTCSGGVCFGGACYTSGCPSGQLCQGGQCLADPCAGLTCPQGTFCRAGACVRSCAGVTCADGQHCGIDGFCEPGPACAVSCGSGQVCQGGQCQPDPACGGVGCGQGQVCRGGSCLDDPCSGVTCPTGTCQGGQCAGGAASSATVPKEAGTKSGCGCGSAGGLDLLALAAGLALWPRLRRRAAPRRGARPAASRIGVAVALALALGTSACGGKTAAERCPTASTPCGTLCCASGYSCQAGSCVFGTANPVVLSVSPSRAGVGSSVTLTLTGEGFQSGASARLTGPGLPAQASLDVTSATTATLVLDLSQAVPGTAEIRVVNPADHLASNAATLALTSDPVPVGVNPTSIRQDATPVDVRVSGSGFGSGLIVTLSRGTFSQDLTPAAVSAQEATVRVDPSTLGIGVYDVGVRFTGGAASPAVKLPVVEGRPRITSALTPACGSSGSLVVGATGLYLYPRSTVYVSGPGLTASPIITRCAQATPDALGQCPGGQLEAVVDLNGAASGTYQVWVVNPGAPAADFESTPKIDFRVPCP